MNQFEIQSKIVAHSVPPNRIYQGVRSVYKNYVPITFFTVFLFNVTKVGCRTDIDTKVWRFVMKRCLYYYYFLWGETPAWNHITLRKLLCGIYKTPNEFDYCCFSLFLLFQIILSEQRLSQSLKRMLENTREWIDQRAPRDSANRYMRHYIATQSSSKRISS